MAEIAFPSAIDRQRSAELHLVLHVDRNQRRPPYLRMRSMHALSFAF
jgi:hypothetical protein